MAAMFSKPKTPTILAPVVVPEADTDTLAKAKKKALTSSTASSGRSSTMLAPSDKL
jgi:hypothetical protein